MRKVAADVAHQNTLYQLGRQIKAPDGLRGGQIQNDRGVAKAIDLKPYSQ